jgi:predicted nucleic acid-binding Zn ribbon protein
VPTYKYKCSENPEHLYKEFRNISDPTPENPICKVEGCGAKLLRIFTAPPINFKGGGYSTNKEWR